MADFLTSYKTVRANEGGYRNVSWDAGGETYKGIARNFHKSWPGWKIVDQYKPLKNGQVLDTLDRMVESFFYTNFWKKNNLDLVKNQSMATLMFDMVVQHGRGPRIINEAVTNLPGNVVYRDTVTAINNDTAIAYSKIADARVKYVEGLKERLGPDYSGVLSRAKRFLSMYAGEAATGGAVIIATIFFF